MHHLKSFSNIVFLLIYSSPLLSSTGFERDLKNEIYQSHMSLNRNIVVDGCTYIDLKSSQIIKKLKGYLCAKDEQNQSYVTITGDFSKPSIEFISLKENRTLWKKNLPAHHKLHIQNNNVYILSQYYKVLAGRKTKFDQLLIFDKLGNKTFEWSTENMVKNNIIFKDGFTSTPQSKIPGGYVEFTHINSFAIHPVKNHLIYLSFPKYSSILILNTKNKEIKIYKTYKEIEGIHSLNIHEGKIVFFANNSLKHKKARSLIYLLDLATGDHERIIDTFADKVIYSNTRGSVQVLRSGDYFISTGQGEYFLYDDKKKKIVLSGKVIVKDATKGFLKKIYDLRISD